MKKHKILIILLVVSCVIFALSVTALFYGEELAAQFDVIGIRIATLLVAFASFCSTSIFSLLVYNHNRTVSEINKAMDRNAELFRELQFASTNYSIIEFMDRMLMYEESSRYIENFILKRRMTFHMIEQSINEEDVFNNPDNYQFISIKIPFRVVEGKMAAQIDFERLRFYRQDQTFVFVTPPSQAESKTYILYNENTKRKNVIINLVVKKDSGFFDPKLINELSKVEIKVRVISLLGVELKGNCELYFTKAEQIESDRSNTYRISSSNFSITKRPQILNLSDSYLE